MELLWSFTPGDRTKNSFIFRCRFANFARRDPLGGRPRRARHFEDNQNHSGFMHDVDALIESMLDLRTATPKSNNERHAALENLGAKRNEQHAASEDMA